MDMASPSSPAPSAIPPQEKYDVFLSFRGIDTRKTFTSHLHTALRGKKINTYIDDILERGDEIGPALLEAIEKSKVSVIIFSQNYAESTWCLDELKHILRCKERYGQIVVPIFYSIDPSYVRKQQGSYARAFRQHEKRFKGSDKVLKWRTALKEASNMSGFDSSKQAGTEAEFIHEVVEYIMTKLNRKSSSDKRLVGMERRMEQVESSLCIDSLDVFTVGIWGMGGIGKTTLANAVFHHLSPKFESSCFLENVREKSEQKDGLVQLRNALVSDILNEKLSISTPTIGLGLLRRMGGTKVLIVLDDVSSSEQLSFLAGDPGLFAPGSRIIVTTRDMSLLRISCEDNSKIYEVEGLNFDEALQLLQLSIFKSIRSRVDFANLSKTVVDYAGGIPFVLQTLGSAFNHCGSEEDWQDEWREFPREKIWKVLRLTYDGLQDHEREFFLDIACFYEGKDVHILKEALEICGFSAAVVIRVLTDKCLISTSTSDRVEVRHNLLQEMGRAIVREQCTEATGKCKRFIVEDANHKLKTKTGRPMVQAVFWDRSLIGEVHLSGAEAYYLRLLYVYTSSCNKYCNVKVSLPDALRQLDCEEYPFKFLPSKLSPDALVELEMHNSKVIQLSKEGQNFKNLKVMDLSLSSNLIKVPDLSSSDHIEHIDLHGCKSLIEIPSCFQYLDKLKYLDLKDCTKLKYLSEMPGNIEYLNLKRTAIEELPSSVWSLENICSLDIQYCRKLKLLPFSSCKLSVITTFSLRGCSSLAKLQELPRNITVLDLSGTAIEKLPTSSVECLLALVEIKLNNCKNFVSLPENIGNLKSLEKLDLSGTAIERLPRSITDLSSLCWLSLTNCKRFTDLPDLPSVHWLDAHGCTSIFEMSLPLFILLGGFDEYCKHFDGRRDQFRFSNCGRISTHLLKDISGNALIRVMQLAIASFKYFEQAKSNVCSVRRSSVSYVYPGSECPSWFKDDNVGSSMTGMLTRRWYGSTGYQFVGFAYSAVVAFDNYNVKGSLRLECTSTLNSNDGHRSPKDFKQVACSGDFSGEFDSDHVFVWFSTFDHASQLNYYTATHQNSITEASFDFSVDCSELEVTRCGVCMLYAPKYMLCPKVNASDDHVLQSLLVNDYVDLLHCCFGPLESAVNNYVSLKQYLFGRWRSFGI